mmetsp:Transcript_1370/g.3145  ORF Transcript_1370/g.3145 Transcript_1370/m.3145 type:complete len:134 (+) Transcript_1370:86-487(+)
MGQDISRPDLAGQDAPPGQPIYAPGQASLLCTGPLGVRGAGGSPLARQADGRGVQPEFTAHGQPTESVLLGGWPALWLAPPGQPQMPGPAQDSGVQDQASQASTRQKADDGRYNPMLVDLARLFSSSSSPSEI